MAKYERSILITGGLLCIVFMIVFGFMRSWQQSLISGGAGVLLLFFSNLRYIAKGTISVKGIELETRQLLDETRATITELRDLAALVASVALSLVKRSGRLGGYEDAEQDKIRAEVLALLAKLKVDQSKIDQAQADWHTFVKFDYVHDILGGSRLLPDLTPAQHEQVRKLKGRGLVDIAPPDQLEAFFSAIDRLDDWRKELIEDYRYYIKNNTHRRPEIWSDRENWSERYRK
jgi:hypothetical protein